MSTFILQVNWCFLLTLPNFVILWFCGLQSQLCTWCTTYLPTDWVIMFKTPSWPLVLHTMLWQQQSCLLAQRHRKTYPTPCCSHFAHFSSNILYASQTQTRSHSYRIQPWDPQCCKPKSSAGLSPAASEPSRAQRRRRPGPQHGPRPGPAGPAPTAMAAGVCWPTAPSLSVPFSRVHLALCKLACPHKKTWPGAVCVVHGSVQTALVSRTKSSPQRRCEDSTSGNTCASLHSCLNPVTQPLSVLGLNTLPTSTCLSSLSLSASGLNNQSGLQAEVHTQENWNGFQPCLHIAWLRCEMRLHSQGRNLGHSQGWSDLLQYPWELLLLSISDSRAMPRQMYYHNIATVLAKPASPGWSWHFS